jgi:hypothetical protein
MKSKALICPCCGELFDSGGHVQCSSNEPISDDNRYYWVSFADGDRFHGVAIVYCADADPVGETWHLGINPDAKHDCSVVFQPLSAADFPLFRNYLGQLTTDRDRVLKFPEQFH